MSRSCSHKVRLQVPATTANLGPGFDCLGMALQWYNGIELAETDEREAGLFIQGAEATEDLPRGQDNLAWKAIRRVFYLADRPMPPLSICLIIDAPLARGLGSSASAIVGGMTAANELLGRPLPPEQLVAEMIALEGHPDNVVACYYGGLTASLVADCDIYVRKYEPAENLRCVLVVPDYQLATSKARKILPKSVPVKNAVFNLARIPFVIDKLCSGDLKGLDVIMDDRLHQPYRRKLIPEYDVVEGEAMNAGAAAVCLSGSGPTILAWTDVQKASEVAAAVERGLERFGRQFLVRIVAPDNHGVKILGAETVGA